MGFNEMTHAFLAARYYIRLTEQFGDRGREAFIHGIQYYGSQRGRRMAQRAIRDGKPLTYENYCRYGEWVNTEEIKAMGAANRVEIGGYDPDYIMNIYSCPWFAQFQKMGAGEAGKGFSVVALEVGKLAKSCTDLNNRITSTVENISDVIHDMADIGKR